MSRRKRTGILLLSFFIVGSVGPARWPNSLETASTHAAYCVSDPSDVQGCIQQDGWYWNYDDCSCHKIASCKKKPGQTDRRIDADLEALVGVIAARIG